MPDAAVTLRDGSTTLDPRVDAILEDDPRSLALYHVRELLEEVPARRRGRAWRAGPVLDQGAEGACVGFALVGEAAASPVRLRRTTAELERLALAIYHRGQELDEWPETRKGGVGGTSPLAGAKASVEFGLFDEYRWGETVDDLVDSLVAGADDPTVAAFGPAVAAVEWRSSMYETGPGGLVDVSGHLVGYHAIFVRGVALRPRKDPTDPLLRWRNSWGGDHGLGGDGLIRASALEGILHQLLFPVYRKAPAHA